MSLVAWPDASAIPDKRKGLGLTQKQLSALSGVAQADISRIENGMILDPSYNTVRKLFEALGKYEQKGLGQKNVEEPVAEDLMNQNVVSVKPYDRTEDAWQIMKSEGFSQLPVIDEGGRVLGAISESTLLSHLAGSKVEDAMGDPFPIVGKSTRSSTLASILRKEQAVLIVEKGKLVGIITKYNLIETGLGKKANMFF